MLSAHDAPHIPVHRDFGPIGRGKPRKTDVNPSVVRDNVVYVTGTRRNLPPTSSNGYYMNELVVCPYTTVHGTLTIVVVVSNVEGHTRMYVATMVNCDRRLNLAWLTLGTVFNRPLAWSREVHAQGDELHAIGNVCGLYQGQEISENAVTTVRIADARYADVEGVHVGDLMLLDTKFDTTGIPLFNSQGMLMGLQLSGNVALTARALKHAIAGHEKSWLGVRARLSTVTDWLQPGIDITKVMLRGYVLMQDYAEYRAGDMLTHLDVVGADKEWSNYELGNRKNQYSPTYVLWKYGPGTSMRLRGLRRLGGYVDCVTTFVTSTKYPVDMDIIGGEDNWW